MPSQPPDLSHGPKQQRGPWRWSRLQPGELQLTLCLAVSIGIVGALITILFRTGVQWVQWVLSGHSGSLVETARGLLWWQRLLVPTVGGVGAGVILQLGMRRIQGESTTDYMEAVALGSGVIRCRPSLVKSASSMVTIASGGSIGREGSMVQLAAMFASLLGRLCHSPTPRLRLLVACGAAAGLASTYNAPIAGAMFVAEIVLGTIAMESFGPLIVASVVANATVHQFLGYRPVYDIPPLEFVSNWEFVFYVPLGMMAGLAAPVFLRFLQATERWFAGLPVPLFSRFALGGIGVGLLSLGRPEVWGNGYSVVNAMLQSDWPWSLLLCVLLCKILATGLTTGSGAVGGVFTPTLFIGAALGYLLGDGVHALLPEATATPSTYAVIGMGSFLAATTHAPMMSILMILEMTRDYQIVLSLMLGCVTAYYMAFSCLGAESIYTASLRIVRTASPPALPPTRPPVPPIP